MSKGHSTQPIPPFPADIDRGHFAGWLSGFSDGEGCFGLTLRKLADCASPVPRANFQISLRADDVAAFHLIRAFWQCGTIVSKFQTPRIRGSRGQLYAASPLCKFCVAKAADLVNVVIPHFDRYPLFAKKRHDYAKWREGALLLYQVSQRQTRGRTGIGGGGAHPKWTAAEREHFVSLAMALKEQRAYREHPSSPQAPPPPPAPVADRNLFDDLP